MGLVGLPTYVAVWLANLTKQPILEPYCEVNVFNTVLCLAVSSNKILCSPGKFPCMKSIRNAVSPEERFFARNGQSRSILVAKTREENRPLHKIATIY